jgi:hypothetical protein
MTPDNRTSPSIYVACLDAWARDAVLGGDVWSERGTDGQVHVFWNR